MRQVALTARLRDDAAAIAAYERCHAEVWPEVIADNAAAGVTRFAIYRRGTTLVLVLTVASSFTLSEYALDSLRSRTWLERMGELMEAIEGEAPGVFWVPLEEVCDVTTLAPEPEAGGC